MDQTPSESGIERPSCNLCGKSNEAFLYSTKDNRYGIDDREWRVVQCRSCALAYLSPRPTPATIGSYYPSRFYVGRDSSGAQARYARQWRYFDELRPGRLLDVGCANGDWMRFAEDKGWKTAGIEPSDSSENPHALDIRRGRIPEALDYPANSFDAVSAWAVFEHLHDPLGAFEAVSRVLRPGGTFVMLVTNIRSLFSRYAYQEDLPRHLYFFSDRTLASYAGKVGMELQRVDHTTDLFGGSGRGVLRVQAFRALGLGVEKYHAFTKLGLGERLRTRPVLATMDAALAGIERAVLHDSVVEALRISGIIVGVFRKP